MCYIFKYLSFVLRDSVVHLPSIFRKDLPVFEGEDLLRRVGEKFISQQTVQRDQTVWLKVTHQSVGNRKRKFHQHLENGLPESVVHLLVCKS